MHTLERLDHTSDPDRLRGWLEAIRLGFHQSSASDTVFAGFRTDLERNGGQARGIWDPRHPDDPRPVATYMAFDKTVNVGGPDLLQAHMITDVTVRPTHRRQGILRQMITADLAEAAGAGVPIAALTVSEASIYARFGFGPVTFEQSYEVDTSSRFAWRTPAPDDAGGSVQMMQPEPALPLMNQVFDRFHAATPGSLDRPYFYQDWISGRFNWESDGPDTKLRAAVHRDADGTPTGYLTYAMSRPEGKPGTVDVKQFLTVDDHAYRALWDFLAAVDLSGRVTVGGLGLDDPLPDMLVDRRCVSVTGRSDAVWFRLLDPVVALQASRWGADGSVVLGVSDPLGHAEGTFAVETADGRATVSRTDRPAEVSIDAATLASLYLGGTSVRTLQRAGRVAGDPAAVRRLGLMLAAADLPFGATYF